MPSRTVKPEHARVTAYREQITLENLLGSLRVLCGGVGLVALLVQAVAALVRGTAGGLFAGTLGEVAIRFAKFVFFLACLWGLLPAWSAYSDANAKECAQRKETLARMEATTGSVD